MKVVSSLTTLHIYLCMMVPVKIPVFINNTSSQKRGETKTLKDCHNPHQSHNSKMPKTIFKVLISWQNTMFPSFSKKHGSVALNPLKIQVAFQPRFFPISDTLQPKEYSGLLPRIWGIANLSLWIKRLNFAWMLTWSHLESLYMLCQNWTHHVHYWQAAFNRLAFHPLSPSFSGMKSN